MIEDPIRRDCYSIRLLSGATRVAPVDHDVPMEAAGAISDGGARTNNRRDLFLRNGSTQDRVAAEAWIANGSACERHEVGAMGSAVVQNLNPNRREVTHQLAQENPRKNAPDGANLLLLGSARGGGDQGGCQSAQ